MLVSQNRYDPARLCPYRTPGRERNFVARRRRKEKERPTQQTEKREEDESSIGRPKNGIAKERGERRILKMFAAMSHEDVDISGFDMLVGPDDRMVAHFQRTVGHVSLFVHARQYPHIGPRRSIVGIPLLAFDLERSAETPHDGMRLIFDVNFCGGERSDVVLEANAAHEIGEPIPHRVAVKFTEQGRVMKSDPASAALFDVFLESGRSSRSPAVGRIVQLDKELVAGKKNGVDFFRVLDVVDRKVPRDGFFREPDFGRIYKRLVNAVCFGEGDDFEFWLLRLGEYRS